MAAAALVRGHNDGGMILFKRVNQLRDQRIADKRMIHGAKEKSICAGRQAMNCQLEGTQLATFPMFVNDYLVRLQQNLRGDSVRIRTKKNAANANAGMFGDIE